MQPNYPRKFDCYTANYWTQFGFAANFIIVCITSNIVTDKARSYNSKPNTYNYHTSCCYDVVNFHFPIKAYFK